MRTHFPSLAGGANSFIVDVLLLMTNGRVRLTLGNFQQATVEKRMIELVTLTQSSIPHELEPIFTTFYGFELENFLWTRL